MQRRRSPLEIAKWGIESQLEHGLGHERPNEVVFPVPGGGAMRLPALSVDGPGSLIHVRQGAEGRIASNSGIDLPGEGGRLMRVSASLTELGDGKFQGELALRGDVNEQVLLGGRKIDKTPEDLEHEQSGNITTPSMAVLHFGHDAEAEAEKWNTNIWNNGKWGGAVSYTNPDQFMEHVTNIVRDRRPLYSAVHERNMQRINEALPFMGDPVAEIHAADLRGDGGEDLSVYDWDRSSGDLRPR